jgi:hypothetical protein
MFFIPGILISILTFSGVIVHEYAHQLACRITGTAVFEVCYFQFENPNGYVVHEPSRKSLHTILISIFPFFVNTILGALISFPAAVSFNSGQPTDLLDMVLMYFGVSIAMHSFPSTTDANTMWRAIWSKEGNFISKIVVTPLAGLIYLGAIGSVVWLDLIYGVGIAMGFPKLIASLF